MNKDFIAWLERQQYDSTFVIVRGNTNDIQKNFMIRQASPWAVFYKPDTPYTSWDDVLAYCLDKSKIIMWKNKT